MFSDRTVNRRRDLLGYLTLLNHVSALKNPGFKPGFSNSQMFSMLRV
jgi:hypothetical protein